MKFDVYSLTENFGYIPILVIVIQKYEAYSESKYRFAVKKKHVQSMTVLLKM